MRSLPLIFPSARALLGDDVVTAGSIPSRARFGASTSWRARLCGHRLVPQPSYHQDESVGPAARHCSGRLDQTPRPELPGLGTPWMTPTTIRYDEGAEVGYRWYAKTGAKPLYAFGHGLSYATFEYGDLQVEGGETVTATNTGDRAGADVPQLYLTNAAGDQRMRLLAFERVQLEPGESRQVTVTADRRRLLARFDGDAGQWRVTEGTYEIAVGRNADDLVLKAEAPLNAQLFGS
jgi:beta-glucosidase